MRHATRAAALLSASRLSPPEEAAHHGRVFVRTLGDRREIVRDGREIVRDGKEIVGDREEIVELSFDKPAVLRAPALIPPPLAAQDDQVRPHLSPPLGRAVSPPHTGRI